MSANAQLQRALSEAGLTREELAKKIDVDPKTVERWIVNGRTPYPVHQQALARELGVNPPSLWAPPKPRGRQPARENSRLRRALFEAGMSHEDLAEKLGLNPKTVERWVSAGHAPFPRHQLAAAVALGVPDSELWPIRRRGAHASVSVDEHGEVLGRQVPDHESNSVAAVQELPRDEHEPQAVAAGQERMRELMSWVPEQRSASADYQPGNALAAHLRDGHDRDEVER